METKLKSLYFRAPRLECIFQKHWNYTYHVGHVEDITELAAERVVSILLEIWIRDSIFDIEDNRKQALQLRDCLQNISFVCLVAHLPWTSRSRSDAMNQEWLLVDMISSLSAITREVYPESMKHSTTEYQQEPHTRTLWTLAAASMHTVYRRWLYFRPARSLVLAAPSAHIKATYLNLNISIQNGGYTYTHIFDIPHI